MHWPLTTRLSVWVLLDMHLQLEHIIFIYIFIISECVTWSEDHKTDIFFIFAACGVFWSSLHSCQETLQAEPGRAGVNSQKCELTSSLNITDFVDITDEQDIQHTLWKWLLLKLCSFISSQGLFLLLYRYVFYPLNLMLVPKALVYNKTALV